MPHPRQTPNTSDSGHSNSASLVAAIEGDLIARSTAMIVDKAGGQINADTVAAILRATVLRCLFEKARTDRLAQAVFDGLLAHTLSGMDEAGFASLDAALDHTALLPQLAWGAALVPLPQVEVEAGFSLYRSLAAHLDECRSQLDFRIGVVVDADASNFNESGYLSENPDIAHALEAGALKSARAHFETFGLAERRKLRAFPAPAARASSG